MTVYIDIVFLENVILNFIILLATALIIKSKVRPLRFLITSSIGSVYTIFEYIIPFSKGLAVLGKMMISCIVVLISFKGNSVKTFVRNLGLFYITSFTFGGIAFMFLFFIKPQDIIFDAGHFVGIYPIKMALLGGIFGLGLIFIVVKLLKRKLIGSSIICDLEVAYRGKNINVKALVDSRELT